MFETVLRKTTSDEFSFCFLHFEIKYGATNLTTTLIEAVEVVSIKYES